MNSGTYRFFDLVLGCWRATGFAVLLSIVTLERAVAKPDIKGLRVRPVTFSTLPGWKRDEHAQAFAAFLRSCAKIGPSGAIRFFKAVNGPKDCRANCPTYNRRALFSRAILPLIRFARHVAAFSPDIMSLKCYGSKGPHEKIQRATLSTSLLTLLDCTNGACAGRPEKSGLPRGLTYAKRTRKGLKAYMTREQIERGGLNGRKLELLWLADPVAVFFLHIQGSGRITLAGWLSRCASVLMARTAMIIHRLAVCWCARDYFLPKKLLWPMSRQWLRNNPKMGRRAMWRNKSFIFFREIPALSGKLGPIGAQGIPLIAGRSAGG